MSKPDPYEGREQSQVKHFILQKYLERFAFIIGTWSGTITYVDCFSGPWKTQTEDMKDTSFAIALGELRKARDAHQEKGRKINLRCFFLEKDPAAYSQLKKFADDIQDVHVEAKNKDLAEAISDIVAFSKNGGTSNFTFIFIDPTGWTGFGMEAIKPLLEISPGEVLVNFMTGHIRRFISLEETSASFEQLFGTTGVRERVQDLQGQDREDALVSAYIESVRRVGKFEYACPAMVLHPQMDRTHFHLIYATRDPMGIEVFKDAEKRAMPFMEGVRAQAQKRKRVDSTGQGELFPENVNYDSSLFERLRARYMDQGRKEVQTLLEKSPSVLYDRAWLQALQRPLTWESDLKGWINEWCKAGLLEIKGMKPSQRVPQRNQNIQLVWKGAQETGGK